MDLGPGEMVGGRGRAKSQAHLLLNRAAGEVEEVELHAVELCRASEAIPLDEHHR